VGNETFYELEAGKALWRFVNHSDVVPNLPWRGRTVASRHFSHGHPARLLGRDSGITIEAVAAAEGDFPFSAGDFGTGLKNPPQWLIEHRIGEYCRKLQRLHLDGMLD